MFDSIHWFDSLIRFLDSIPWFDPCIRFIDSIHWFDSLIRFIESIHWFHSLIRFIESIHWFYSLIPFIDSLHWFDSLIWFLDSVHWFDSLIRFTSVLFLASLCKTMRFSQVYCFWLPRATRYSFQKCIVFGFGSPNPLFYRCKWLAMVILSVLFAKPLFLRCFEKQPVRSAGVSPQCCFMLCVCFCVVPSLNPNENP